MTLAIKPQHKKPLIIGGALLAAIYAALGASAASVALGSGSLSSQSQQQTASGVMAWPAGHMIVVVTGLIIIGVGVAEVVKGVTKSFSEEIDTSSMSPVARKGVARLGQVGYIAKGVALGVVGGLLSYAALTFERQNAQGLDGALQAILAQPFGTYLLTAVALGFVALHESLFSWKNPSCRAKSASSRRSTARARNSRLITVPIGTARAAEISL